MVGFKYAIAAVLLRFQGRSVAANYIWGGP